MTNVERKQFEEVLHKVLIPFLEEKGFRQQTLEANKYADGIVYDFMREAAAERQLFAIQLEKNGGKMFKVLIASAGSAEMVFVGKRGRIPVTKVCRTANPMSSGMRARLNPHPKWNPLAWMFPFNWFRFNADNFENVCQKIIRLFPQLEVWWSSPQQQRVYQSHVFNDDIVPQWLRTVRTSEKRSKEG